MTTFPAFSKLTVIKSAMDWTCPIPQSGRAGLTTSSPGSRKVFRTCIVAYLWTNPVANLRQGQRQEEFITNEMQKAIHDNGISWLKCRDQSFF